MTESALKELAIELASTRISLHIIKAFLETKHPGFEERFLAVFEDSWDRNGPGTIEECYRTLIK